VTDESKQPGPSRPSTLLVLVGPPGTGKSTVAQRLKETIGADIVQTDAIRKALVSEPTYLPSESAWVHRVAQQRCRQKLSRGQDVIFDATNLRKSHRKRLRDLAKAARAQFLTLVVWAPQHVIRNRLQQRQDSPNPSDKSDADWAVYQHLVKTFEPLDERHIIVNSTVDLEPVLQLVSSVISSMGPVL